MTSFPNQPAISVVMPVYNCAKFVVAAIESILSQTWQDFELIIIDDASTDETFQICETYAKTDQRLRLFRNQQNLGVAKTANFAVSYAQAKYIARMDGDDIALPDRLVKQKEYLDGHPDVVAVGGQCVIIDEQGAVTGVKKFPTTTAAARQMLYTGLPIQQPTMMLNRSLLPDDFVWYVETDRPTGEEISLLFRLLQHGEIVALPDDVLKYRIHRGNLTLKHLKKGFFLTYATRQRAVKEFGYRPTWWARLISRVQWLVISLIPEALMWPIYRLVRGMNQQPGKNTALWWSPYLAVFLVFLLLLLTNLPAANNWLLGWDSLSPEMAPAANWQRLVYASWQEYQGLGLLGGMAHGADLTRFIVLWPLMMVASTNSIRYIWLFAMILLGAFGVVKLVKWLLDRQGKKPSVLSPKVINLLAALGGIFYLFNLGTAQNFYFPLETFTSFYGFLPWLIWVFLYVCESKKPSRFFLFFIINWLAVSSFAVQTMFIVYAILLVILAVREIFAARGKNLISILLSALIIIAVNFYWLVPVGIFTLTNVNATVESRQNLISTPTSQILNRVAGTPLNTFLLKGYWFDYEISDPLEKRPVYVFFTWREHLENRAVFALAMALSCFCVIGLIGALIRRRNFAATIFLLYLLTFIMLSAGNGLPGLIFNFARDHVPLFSQIFRTTFTKWIALASLIYSLGLVFFLRELYVMVKHFKLSRLAFLAPSGGLVLGAMIVCWPFLRHHLISHYMELPLPETTQKVFSYLKTMPVSRRGLNLPFNNLWGWQSNTWGYMGSGFLWYGIAQPLADRNFDVWSSANETMYLQINKAVYDNDRDLLLALLEHYQITWLLFDKTVIMDNPTQMATQYALWRDVATAGGYSAVISDENLTLYVLDEPMIAQNWLYLQKDTAALWRTEQSNYLAFAQNYYTSPQTSQNHLFYPFSYLTTGDNLNQPKITQQNLDQTMIDLPAILPDDVDNQSLVLPAYQAGEIIIAPFHTQFNGTTLILDPASEVSLLDDETPILTLPQLPKLSFDFSDRLDESSASAVASAAIGYNYQSDGPTVPMGQSVISLQLEVANPINLTFNLFDETGNLLAIISEDLPTSVWNDFIKEHRLTLAGDASALHWRVLTKGYQIDDKAINFVECQQRITGGAGMIEAAPAETTDNEGVEITVAGSGRACIQVLLGKYFPATDTLLNITARNERGAPLNFWLQDAQANNVIYENTISEENFTLGILVNPELESRHHDAFYVLNLNSTAYGEVAANVLEQIDIYHLPLNYLSRLILVDDATRNPALAETPKVIASVDWQRSSPTRYRAVIDEPGILVFGQAYNDFWQAHLANNSEPLTHVLANGWANGWEITPELLAGSGGAITVDINFGVQKWVTLGYVFWLITGLAAGAYWLFRGHFSHKKGADL